MHITDVFAEDGSPGVLAPPNAMTIVALERQNLHEKIARLRALREAAEPQKEPAEIKRAPHAHRWIPA